MESRKRGYDELEPYPSRKQTVADNEQPKLSTVTLLGTSLLAKNTFEADKENLEPRDSPNQTLIKLDAPRTIAGKTLRKEIESGRLRLEHVSSNGKKYYSEKPLLNTRDRSVENLLQAKTSEGEIIDVQCKKEAIEKSFDNSIGMSSNHVQQDVRKAYYGIEIAKITTQLDGLPKSANNEAHQMHSGRIQSSLITPSSHQAPGKACTMLWTEKYRARKFTDLVGDDRIHRDVLRWLKGWDSIVSPRSGKLKPVYEVQKEEQNKLQKKILIISGPSGLGKTTLAHVCAKQAGYEVLEINASDERSRDIVKGKIRDCVGTENVKKVTVRSNGRSFCKQGRPFCVIVDEVDGAHSGAGGGEGSFIKALIDLVMLDQKNSNLLSNHSGHSVPNKKKSDKFRLLRPIILICNDIYHSTLRPLRAASIAEIVHIRKPPLDKVVSRLSFVLKREGIANDKDGVRRLCEATWGLASQSEKTSQSSGTCEGDMRSILVAAEGLASRFRQGKDGHAKLTKQWIEEGVLHNLSHSGGATRDIGRSNAREAVNRVFRDGAGFAASELTSMNESGVSDTKFSKAQVISQNTKQMAMQRLQNIVDTSGESDRIIADCFAAYPAHEFQDDSFLSKPNAAYDWLYFHDRVSSRIHSGQEWDLGSYLSQSVLGLHHIFASSDKQHISGDRRQWKEEDEEFSLFLGPKADYEASEATKENQAMLLGLQSSLSTALLRSFGSVADIAVELVPNVNRMLEPDVKPVIASGTGSQRSVVSVRKEEERRMIQRAVVVMSAVGVSFKRCQIDAGQAGVSSFIYRMEPPLDSFTTWKTTSQTRPATPTGFAIRQALEQEHEKFIIKRSEEICQARYAARHAGDALQKEKEDSNKLNFGDPRSKDGSQIVRPEHLKRDFFGRTICGAPWPPYTDRKSPEEQSHRLILSLDPVMDQKSVWISFHEGFSNAVRKPIMLEELLRDL